MRSRDIDNYINDLVNLTGLPRNIVVALLDKFKLIVGHELYESMVNGDSMESRCLGIGKLVVEVDNSSDNYKVSFKLSKSMKNIIDNILDNQESPLIVKLNEDLVNKIVDIFKKEVIG